MRRFLLVFAGLMVGMAHAQSFDWSRAWSGCSAEASAFDAESRRQSTPEHTARKVMRYVEEITGTPPTVAKLRAKMEEDRGVLRDAKNWAYLIQLSSKLALCGTTAALNQLQNGSTSITAAAPSRPAQSNPSASSSGRDRPDLAAHHCLDRSSDRLRNNCNQKLAVNWCTDDYGTYGCGNNNLGWSLLDPGDSTYLSAPKVWWFACALPARPSEVEYLPGRGLRGACTE